MSVPPESSPTPRRRGRPRAAVAKIAASTWIPTADYDRLARLALKRDQSVSAVIADLLTRKMPAATPRE